MIFTVRSDSRTIVEESNMYLKKSLAIAFAVALGTAACSSSAPNPTDKAESALDQANLKDVAVDAGPGGARRAPQGNG